MADVMDFLLVLAGATGGLALSGLLLWKLGLSRPSADPDVRVAEARLEELRRSVEEQRRLVQSDEARLMQSFDALAAASLQRSSEQFLTLAAQTLETRLQQAEGDLGKRQEAIQGVVKPLRENLEKVEKYVMELEEKRQKAYGSLDENLRRLAEQQTALQRETGNLSSALRNTKTRGKWGELTLKRVVELAGMTEHCDFSTQVAVTTDDKRIRPDLLVRMPAGRSVVVDAKVPLDAYLDAMAATTDEDRKSHMERHAKAVRKHVDDLRNKSYWTQFDEAPDFVVLFLPGEAFFSAALEADPALHEEAAADHVILASPTTLIALLRAVEHGWRQQRMAESAKRISEVGRELHDRLVLLSGHFEAVGKSLEKSVDHFNKAASAYDSRVVPSARKLKEMGAAGNEDVDAPPLIEKRVRTLQVAGEAPAARPE